MCAKAWRPSKVNARPTSAEVLFRMAAMQTLRHARQLTRFVLVWFALALGVAMASPLVSPKSIDVVCSSGGVMKMVASDDGDTSPNPAAPAVDCPFVPVRGFPACTACPAGGETFSPVPCPATDCSGAHRVGHRAAAAFSRPRPRSDHPLNRLPTQVLVVLFLFVRGCYALSSSLAFPPIHPSCSLVCCRFC